MNTEIRQIALRIAGLRDALEASVEDFASACGVTMEKYLSIEKGECDIPVSILHNLAQQYHIELATLMFGNEPHATAYALTRKGTGATVERTKAYKYEALGGVFSHRKADPFIVTVEPKEAPIYLNSHSGQEFNLVLEGELLLSVNGKEIIMREGDSIYFDATRPHGMKALGKTPAKFLAIIL